MAANKTYFIAEVIETTASIISDMRINTIQYFSWINNIITTIQIKYQQKVPHNVVSGESAKCVIKIDDRSQRRRFLNR